MEKNLFTPQQAVEHLVHDSYIETSLKEILEGNGNKAFHAATSCLEHLVHDSDIETSLKEIVEGNDFNAILAMETSFSRRNKLF